MIETAYAKLNLALHVRSRGDDGYHAIETLFAFCEDGDVLTLGEEPGLRVTGSFAGALAGEGDNLIQRAERIFRATFGGAEAGFTLDKRLPVAAGIGGGSADAAAALRLLVAARDVSPTDPRLKEIAAGLGADVPACLGSQATRGTGRGDMLARVESAVLAQRPALLVNPRIALATGPVFAGWDRVDRGALAEGDLLEAALAGRNDLEPPARALVPEIGEVVTALAAQPGVRLARMSGSGATCFALFETIDARDAADHAIAMARPDWWRLSTRLRG